MSNNEYEMDYQKLPDRMIPASKITPSKQETVKRKGAFIKGPIDLEWISAVSQLPGKALNVGLALMWLSGLKKSKNKLKLTKTAYKVFNVTRQSSVKALQAMEAAKLIALERSSGRKTLVTVLDVSKRSKGNLYRKQ